METRPPCNCTTRWGMVVITNKCWKYVKLKCHPFVVKVSSKHRLCRKLSWNYFTLTIANFLTLRVFFCVGLDNKPWRNCFKKGPNWPIKKIFLGQEEERNNMQWPLKVVWKRPNPRDLITLDWLVKLLKTTYFYEKFWQSWIMFSPSKKCKCGLGNEFVWNF